jgi:hypothetical protein
MTTPTRAEFAALAARVAALEGAKPGPATPPAATAEPKMDRLFAALCDEDASADAVMLAARLDAKDHASAEVARARAEDARTIAALRKERDEWRDAWEESKRAEAAKEGE